MPSSRKKKGGISTHRKRSGSRKSTGKRCRDSRGRFIKCSTTVKPYPTRLAYSKRSSLVTPSLTRLTSSVRNNSRLVSRRRNTRHPDRVNHKTFYTPTVSPSKKFVTHTGHISSKIRDLQDKLMKRVNLTQSQKSTLTKIIQAVPALIVRVAQSPSIPEPIKLKLQTGAILNPTEEGQITKIVQTEPKLAVQVVQATTTDNVTSAAQIEPISLESKAAVNQAVEAAKVAIEAKPESKEEKQALTVAGSALLEAVKTCGENEELVIGQGCVPKHSVVVPVTEAGIAASQAVNLVQAANEASTDNEFTRQLQAAGKKLRKVIQKVECPAGESWDVIKQKCVAIVGTALGGINFSASVQDVIAQKMAKNRKFLEVEEPD